ncbi:hypothetical protein [Methylobacterium frigidaeris]|uniref:hypothetical protein n=1 Tax=Methylobacterium frigidaeris TaxID=2038277 RepID=UPI000C1A765E|nr:hypothetical protein [Methylobacterium frigidaeris]PIK74848.1 hypothetical protein CS379_00360 [Methylobacterium frigidaeris]
MLAGSLLASAASARSAQPSDAFEACLDRAAGDPGAIQLCADAAVAAESAKLNPGNGPAGADFAQALVALGDDAVERGLFGSGRAAEVAVAQAGVRLARARSAFLRGNDPPAAGRTEPTALGPDAQAAWARSRRSDCAAHTVADCAARYDALLSIYARADLDEEARPAPRRPSR